MTNLQTEFEHGLSLKISVTDPRRNGPSEQSAGLYSNRCVEEERVRRLGFFTRRAVSVGGLLWASSLMATVAPSGAQCVAEMLLFSGFDRLRSAYEYQK